MQFFPPNTTSIFPQNSILTIGTFDGVHGGHQQILQQLRHLAAQKQSSSTLITFEPHPRWVLHKGNFQLLSPLSEKRQLIEQFGIDNMVVIPFTTDFSQQSPEQYIADFLVAKFAPLAIVIGYDHRFGHDRSGDLHLLQHQGKQHGFEVIEISKQLIDDIVVSSTQIRNALLNGNITTANHLLGYDYHFSGIVVKGQQLGNTIGFPTANLSHIDPQKLIPAKGVYAVQAKIGTTTYPAMMNIGNRPTVDGTHETIEVHLLNFEGQLYDQTLTVYCIERLRNEQKFPSLADLQAQLHADKQQAITLLNR